MRALLKICVPQKQAAQYPMRPSNSQGRRSAPSTQPQSLVRMMLERSMCVTGPRLLPRTPRQDFEIWCPGCRFWFLPLGPFGRKTKRRNSPASGSPRGWPPLPEPNRKSLCISRVNLSVSTSSRGINTPFILPFAWPTEVPSTPRISANLSRGTLSVHGNIYPHVSPARNLRFPGKMLIRKGSGGNRELPEMGKNLGGHIKQNEKLKGSLSSSKAKKQRAPLPEEKNARGRQSFEPRPSSPSVPIPA